MNVILVGDAGVGKTSLMYAYAGAYNNAPPNFPTPDRLSVFGNYAPYLKIDGRDILVSFLDTTGRPGYDQLRPLTYNGVTETDLIFICFSLVSPTSYENVAARWIPEITKYCKKVPSIILVGLKLDLRSDKDTVDKLQEEGMQPISTEQGIKKQKEIGALLYCEATGSHCNDGVQVLFKESFRVHSEHLKTKDSKCSIM